MTEPQPPEDAIPAPPATTLALSSLSRAERARLAELRAKVEGAPYPQMLGLGWQPSRGEIERRARDLLGWLDEISERSGLTADDRAALRLCRQHLPQAVWVLTHPTLAARYLKAARSRHEAERGGAPAGARS